MVLNASFMNGSSTTATCNSSESAIALHSQRLVNSLLKALPRSERALKQLNSWARTSVVKAIVRASSMLPAPPR